MLTIVYFANFKLKSGLNLDLFLCIILSAPVGRRRREEGKAITKSSLSKHAFICSHFQLIAAFTFFYIKRSRLPIQ